jgi:O-methyltransferase involved in polyketide biosynthesis
MSKLNAHDLVGVPETLLIPLHYRVAASRTGSAAFRDETAERFHHAIAYDWEKFESRQLPGAGIEARTRILDR